MTSTSHVLSTATRPHVLEPIARAAAKQGVGLVGSVVGCFAGRASRRREAAELERTRGPSAGSRWADSEARGGSCRKCGGLLRRSRVSSARSRGVGAHSRRHRGRMDARGGVEAKQGVGLVGSVVGCFAGRASRQRGAAELERTRDGIEDEWTLAVGWRRSKGWVLSEVWWVASPVTRLVNEEPRSWSAPARVLRANAGSRWGGSEARGGSCRKCGRLLRRSRVSSTRSRGVGAHSRAECGLAVG
jgi:hypothetical protein